MLNQDVRWKDARMTLLNLIVVRCLVGAFLTGLEKIRKTEPTFESGALAFYQDDFGLHACYVASKDLSHSDVFSVYPILTSSSVWILMPSYQLLTGWEDDFPGMNDIDWGHINLRDKTEDYETMQDDPGYWSEMEWREKIDDSYYQQLAEEWEEWDSNNVQVLSNSQTKKACRVRPGSVTHR